MNGEPVTSNHPVGGPGPWCLRHLWKNCICDCYKSDQIRLLSILGLGIASRKATVIGKTKKREIVVSTKTCTCKHADASASLIARIPPRAVSSLQSQSVYNCLAYCVLSVSAIIPWLSFRHPHLVILETFIWIMHHITLTVYVMISEFCLL